MKNILKPIATKALIGEIYNYFPDRILLNMNHAMKNHIIVEEASMTRRKHPYF